MNCINILTLIDINSYKRMITIYLHDCDKRKRDIHHLDRR